MHEVMDAMVTAPWSISNVWPSSVTFVLPAGPADVGRDALAELVRLALAALARADRVGGREGLRDRLVVAVERRRGVHVRRGVVRRRRRGGHGLVVVHVRGERLAEALLGLGQDDPVLRPLRAGDARHDGAEVELEVLGVARLAVVVVPEALLLRVRLDERDLVLVPAGQAQVVGGLGVDREHGDGRAVLRAHVADRRPVGQRHGRDAGSVELDELPDHLVLAQHLGDGQHQVGRRGALGHRAAELEADDARDEHRHGLAEHGRLGLDAADAPADDAQAVDHRGVRVGADAGVRVGLTPFGA